jgi:hypothetical protein
MEKIKNLFSLVIKFFQTWNELILGPVSIVLWVISIVVIHFLDQTAATYDVAVFQKIIFALTAFCAFSFSAWLLCRVQFPKVFQFLSESFDSNFSTLTPLQQCVISLCVLAYYLLGLALCGLIL